MWTWDIVWLRRLRCVWFWIYIRCVTLPLKNWFCFEKIYKGQKWTCFKILVTVSRMWWILHQCGLMNESDKGGGWGSKASQGWSGLVLPPPSPYLLPIQKSRPPPQSLRLLCQPPPCVSRQMTPHWIFAVLASALACDRAQIGFFPVQKPLMPP